MKFYKCKKCNQIITTINNETPKCCEEFMEELIPGSADAAKEKHIPVVSYNDKDGYCVVVGEVEHPMLEEHYIEWIAFQLENDEIKVINLKPGKKPNVNYKTTQKVKVVYAYCNLHGLWKVDL